MKCFKCGKDMRPPPLTPALGLILGIRAEDFLRFEKPENILKEYGEYCKRQFGKYDSEAYGICCECILDSFSS